MRYMDNIPHDPLHLIPENRGAIASLMLQDVLVHEQ